MTLRISFVVLLGLMALPVQAANLDNLNGLSQREFRLFSEDLGAALSYKPLTPATPLGLTGFDIGVQVTYTKFENSGLYKIATNSDDASIILPQLRAYKGLPLGIDIGVSYAAIPDSNIRLVGAELRYAILSGGVATPAIGVRASYTSLEGVSQLDLRTKGLDLSISKGFAFFTPYAGVGKVWVTATPDPSIPLTEEDSRLTKYFVGFNLNFAIVNIAIEGDRTGDTNSYGAKVGLRF
jgi:hypothetical protein